MIKKSAICFAVAGVAFWGLVGCNSSSSDELDTTYLSSVLVSSFSLTEDDDVLEDLDSVYFSIDMVKAQIFNADSLPYGTDVTALVPVISTPNGVSVAELHVPRPGQADTIYDYLTNSTDSIDFSNGAVKLHLVSLDGVCSRDYEIKVNVHTQKSDTLAWGKVAMRNLPSKLSKVKAQRTAAQADQLYCLTTDGTGYSVATTDNPGKDEWTTYSVTIPFDIDINSFIGSDDALYALSATGDLYKSADGAKSWINCDTKMDNLYGAYGTTLYGSVKRSDGWYMVTYPAGTDEAIAADFPVSGASLPLTFEFSDSNSAQMLITGGRLASDALSSATWGFDGSVWAKLSTTGLPVALEDLAVVPYFTYKTTAAKWKKGRYATLVAIGGKDSDGNLNKTVYASTDYGLTWSEADSLMQLPEYIPAMVNLQGFVYQSTLTSRSSSAWTSYPTRRIPSYLQYLPTAVTSRVTEAITEWECPYIYLFGGENADGQLYDTIWRGVINRFTFKPLV
jgi:hypothetical protein